MLLNQEVDRASSSRDAAIGISWILSETFVHSDPISLIISQSSPTLPPGSTKAPTGSSSRGGLSRAVVGGGPGRGLTTWGAERSLALAAVINDGHPGATRSLVSLVRASLSIDRKSTRLNSSHGYIS